MASYVESALLPGEVVAYETRLHWVVYTSGCLIVALGFVLLAIPAIPVQIGILAFVVGIGGLISAQITRSTSEFAVTNRRVIVKTGWLSRRTMEMNLSKIESIDVDQSIVSRVLGYGRITVVGTGATREPFERIANPMEFRRAVQTQTP